MTLLEVDDLTTYFSILRGDVKAVENVSFKISEGESFGLAGESGCGKTTTALSILRLLPMNGKVKKGEIRFKGKNLLGMKPNDYRRDIRWKQISVVFQGAMNSLNPIMTVGSQISEAITIHENISKDEALDRVGKLLDLVGIGAERIDRYPHELSGGMRQRAIIAMSLASNPSFIVADEPTTALDVIIEAQVLKVLKDLQQKLNISMLVISHDLSMIAETCDRIGIMYAGYLVERGDIARLYKEPLHPYTKLLLGAFPSIIGPKTALTRISGFPPDLLSPPPGCRFHPRCPYAQDKCKKEIPKTIQIEEKDHFVACHLVR